MSIPIIDSHIHLFPLSHVTTLAWYNSSNPLCLQQHSVDEYRHATSTIPTSSPHDINSETTSSTHLRGFIFLETDRKSSLDPAGWSYALNELSFLSRVAAGSPITGEGHKPVDSSLCLGIVPWAPVPAGPEVLQEYLAKVYERLPKCNVRRLVKGVRYLLQDKPSGTMLTDGFVNSLKWLGSAGLTFDLGVDAKVDELCQLHEAVKVLQQVHREDVEDNQRLRIIISASYPLSIPYDDYAST